MELSYIGDYAISLATLTFLEVVLGVDNLVFIAVITNQLPKHSQRAVRRFGLLFAMVTRLLLLAGVFWLTQFTKPMFTLMGMAVSFRDCLLVSGGLFLIYKATQEIHRDISDEHSDAQLRKMHSPFMAVVQIGILDVVFSFDSVITAIGMTNNLTIMSIAIIIAIGIMLFLSDSMTDFINENPTVKMLALSFLLMIGMVLIADGMHFHVPRQYLYFAITFSLFVEFLNTLMRKKRKPKSSKTSEHSK